MASVPQRNIILDCARDCGLTVSEVHAIERTAPKRYYVWTIPKRSGGLRTVCHPASELKAVQEYFLRCVLNTLPVHPNATAYVKGSSIRRNAQAHVSSRVILKIDFKDFFNRITVKNWLAYAADHFPEWTEDELAFSSHILFWGSGSYEPKCLAIGAPTSPMLSNALMYEIDLDLSRYAAASGLVYTRYADDIVFSSLGKLDNTKAIRAVKKALKRAKYSNVIVNSKKTMLISNQFSRRVTGLVLTPDRQISLGRDRKRLISAMVHRLKLGRLNSVEAHKLRGLVAFAQDVEPTFVLMLRKKYGSKLINKNLEWGGRAAD